MDGWSELNGAQVQLRPALRRTFHMSKKCLGPALSVLLGVAVLHAQNYVNSELPWHDAVLDSGNKLLAWHEAEKNLGYDHVLRLAWDYMEHKAATDPKTGLKVYLINSTYDAKTGLGGYWQHNPASTYGQFVDSFIGWYPYSGDKEAGPMGRRLPIGIGPASPLPHPAPTNWISVNALRTRHAVFTAASRPTSSENWVSAMCSSMSSRASASI